MSQLLSLRVYFDNRDINISSESGSYVLHYEGKKYYISKDTLKILETERMFYLKTKCGANFTSIFVESYEVGWRDAWNNSEPQHNKVLKEDIEQNLVLLLDK